MDKRPINTLIDRVLGFGKDLRFAGGSGYQEGFSRCVIMKWWEERRLSGIRGKI